jgi:2-methylcitrate dehydratase PrpD
MSASLPDAAAAAPFTKQLATFVAELRLSDVPAPALAVARSCMLDTVGVALAGVPEPAGRKIIDFVREEGAAPAATVLGAGFRTSAANAAFANGTTGHALDFDDVSPPMRGHPSVVCTSAAFAAAEAGGKSGAAAVLGYVAGVEAMVCLAYAVGRKHYDLGWHSTSTLGSIAAAAAAAKVRGLTAAQTCVALAIGASLASGVRRNFGSMTKPLHAGHAAKNGVTAAALAARDFTADAAAIEASFGFLALVTDSARPEAVARLGREWGILQPGLNLKRHPCCYAAHHAIDAILELRNEHHLNSTEVERIDVLVAPRGLTALIHDRPRSGLEAKFSLPYTLAAALVDGVLPMSAFTDDMVMRPALQALLRKVQAREAEGDPVSVETPRFAEVTLTLTDGRKMQRRIQYPRGAAANPMTPDELDAKFRDCASLSLQENLVEQALQMLHEVDRLPDVRGLMAVLAGTDC